MVNFPFFLSLLFREYGPLQESNFCLLHTCTDWASKVGDFLPSPLDSNSRAFVWSTLPRERLPSALVGMQVQRDGQDLHEPWTKTAEHNVSRCFAWLYTPCLGMFESRQGSWLNAFRSPAQRRWQFNFESQNHRVTQNHRTAAVGRDLMKTNPAPLLKQVPYSTLHR